MRSKPMHRRDGAEVQPREWMETQRDLICEFATQAGAVSHDQRELMARLWGMSFAATARQTCETTDLESFVASFRHAHSKLYPLLADGQWIAGEPLRPTDMLPPVRAEAAAAIERERAALFKWAPAQREVAGQFAHMVAGSSPYPYADTRARILRFWSETFGDDAYEVFDAAGHQAFVEGFRQLNAAVFAQIFARKYLISERVGRDVGYAPVVFSGTAARVDRHPERARGRLDLSVTVPYVGRPDPLLDARHAAEITLSIDLTRNSIDHLLEREVELAA